MKKFIAELIGTATLVLIGCGTAVLAGAEVGHAGIAAAFGLAIVAMAYGIGPISGCHINPAVSLGAFVSGRMSAGDMIQYWIAQFIGAAIGAGILYMIATGRADYSLAENGLGQNGWGAGYLGEYSLQSALIFEIVATFLFVTVILGATQTRAPTAFAGLAIGLTLWGIHLLGIQVTGVSVNPARSFGPALFTGLGQLWLFFVAPLIGAVLAGLLFRTHLLEETFADDEAALEVKGDI
ncbi:aquaporin [Algimonas porphyrae]|uniref:Aquaporin n=1 Tax=Algimonas porphyrae TaxID=1128113 RepID=A0ABQ5UVA0_9PROT|nr:aquaporin [Algimonas porphyrae]